MDGTLRGAAMSDLLWGNVKHQECVVKRRSADRSLSRLGFTLFGEHFLLSCYSAEVCLCSYFYILKTVRGQGTMKNRGAGLNCLDAKLQHKLLFATSSEGWIIHWGLAVVNDSSVRSNSVLGLDVTPGQSHLRLLTQLAAILADVRLKRVTSRSSHLVPSINTAQFPGLQIHLSP